MFNLLLLLMLAYIAFKWCEIVIRRLPQDLRKIREAWREFMIEVCTPVLIIWPITALLLYWLGLFLVRVFRNIILLIQQF
ncbi:hypothetical protein JXA32_06515 [Candidatus Sumerlaeota bacterium]|nr:hypothetical protein [Candidatus Sumerlaeota bacterium]